MKTRQKILFFFVHVEHNVKKCKIVPFENGFILILKAVNGITPRIKRVEAIKKALKTLVALEGE